MDSAGARRGAYIDLLTGLVDLRDDTATQRFDALLQQAVDEGRVEASVARELRYWQREAQRSLADHLVATAAGSLEALDAARRADADATQRAARVLAPAARESDGLPRRAATSPIADDTADPLASEAASPVEATTPPPPDLPAAAPPAPTGRHRASALDARLSASTETEMNIEAEPPPAARRRRLLVAGLTVIGNDQTPQHPHPASTTDPQSTTAM